MIVSKYVAESITMIAGHFGYEGFVKCVQNSLCISGSFPCDRCMHRLSIPEIPPLCFNCKAYNPLTSVGCILFLNGFFPLQEQNTTLNIIQSIPILYNAYGHGKILPQKLN